MGVRGVSILTIWVVRRSFPEDSWTTHGPTRDSCVSATSTQENLKEYPRVPSAPDGTPEPSTPSLSSKESSVNTPGVDSLRPLLGSLPPPRDPGRSLHEEQRGLSLEVLHSDGGGTLETFPPKSVLRRRGSCDSGSLYIVSVSRCPDVSLRPRRRLGRSPFHIRPPGSW